MRRVSYRSLYALMAQGFGNQGVPIRQIDTQHSGSLIMPEFKFFV